MVSHICARPHHFGRVYAGLLVAEESRRNSCKLCLRTTSNKETFLRHITDSHLMDDILLEASVVEGNVRAPGAPRYYCPECPWVGYMNNTNMIEHRNKMHNAALRIYKRIQVTARSLHCKLCPSAVPPFVSLAALKHHLATQHFHREMTTCLRDGEKVSCKLCCQELVERGRKHDFARHVGVRHNYMEVLYADELANPRPIQCDLCGAHQQAEYSFFTVVLP